MRGYPAQHLIAAMGSEIGQIVVVTAKQRVFPGGQEAPEVRLHGRHVERSLAIRRERRCEEGLEIPFSERYRHAVASPEAVNIARRPSRSEIEARQAESRAQITVDRLCCETRLAQGADQQRLPRHFEEMRRAIAFEQCAQLALRECVARRIARQGRCQKGRRFPKARGDRRPVEFGKLRLAEEQHAVEHATPSKHVEIGGQ